jgi:uncharacterized membrane protein required for colicin V production
MLDQALIASMTWLDWVIVGIPTVLVLIGLLVGGTSLMLFGLVRFLTAVPVAAMPVAYVAMNQKGLLQQFAVMTGLSFAAASGIAYAAIFIVALIIVYSLLGILWRGLRAVLSSSGIGRALDRLIGIPLGLSIGVLLCAIAVIPPSVQFRSTIPQPDQPPGLRNSVLIPMVEQQIRELIRYLPAPGG